MTRYIFLEFKPTYKLLSYKNSFESIEVIFTHNL